MEGAEEWARARIEEVERSNAVLLRKGREDARMLQGRELELQIFDRRLAKAGSRVEILEVLLQDTRHKYTKLKMQVAFLPSVLLGLIATKPRGLHGFLIVVVDRIRRAAGAGHLCAVGRPRTRAHRAADQGAPPPLFPPVLTGQASSLPSYLLDTPRPSPVLTGHVGRRGRRTGRSGGGSRQRRRRPRRRLGRCARSRRGCA